MERTLEALLSELQLPADQLSRVLNAGGAGRALGADIASTITAADVRFACHAFTRLT